MQNAHERFALLEFVKRTKDTTTRVRVHLDRAVLEPKNGDQTSATDRRFLLKTGAHE